MVIKLSNETEVRNYLLGTNSSPMTQALNYTMEQIVARNKELILKIIYDNYSPKSYERTREFLESWKYEIHTFRRTGLSMVSATFEQNLESMSVNNEKAQHGSPFIYGEDWWKDSREYLADIIYNGKSGKVFGRGPWTRKRDVWTPLIQSVESKIYKWYKDGLENVGLFVK